MREAKKKKFAYTQHIHSTIQQQLDSKYHIFVVVSFHFVNNVKVFPILRVFIRFGFVSVESIIALLFLSLHHVLRAIVFFF